MNKHKNHSLQVYTNKEIILCKYTQTKKSFSASIHKHRNHSLQVYTNKEIILCKYTQTQKSFCDSNDAQPSFNTSPDSQQSSPTTKHNRRSRCTVQFKKIPLSKTFASILKYCIYSNILLLCHI
jgi:hypothetical protein